MPNYPVNHQPDAGMCPTTVREIVCVQAEVTICPKVSIGTIKTFSVGCPVIGPCHGTPVDQCSFTVRQNICVQVPLTLSVDASAAPLGIVCGTPAVGKYAE